MSWSEQQRQAIAARGQNVLVAAAAGSGKTSVLVGRIIRRVTDPEDPVDLDRLLVVTYTNAAAAEMRARIGAALSESLRAAPHSPHLERQTALLNTASISTLHSFCHSIVRQYFYLLDLDPKFRVAGETEIDLLQTDVLEKMFADRYAAGDASFLQLVDHYGDENSDDPLYRLVLALYAFSRSHPWPALWLKGLQDPFTIPDGADIDATPWSGLIRAKVILELEQAQQTLDSLCREAIKPGNPAAYAGTFAADRVLLDEIIAAARCSWKNTHSALADCRFETIARVGREVPQERREYFRKERDRVKDKVKTIRDTYFSRPPEELLADMRAVAPLVRILSELVAAFGVEFGNAKRAKGLLDFSDLEHFCLQVLLDPDARPGELKPSPVALAMRDKFIEVMVDEYQDINGVQEAILRLLTHADRPNLFLVGDVKQSIYRFRLAEPELFLEKYRQYFAAANGYGRRIDLAQNFRSRPGILHAVNFLFTQLMSRPVTELEYGEAERLNPGPDYPPTDRPVLNGPVELHLIDRDRGESRGEEQDTTADADADHERDEAAEGAESSAADDLEPTGFELEARLVARRIGELMAAGYYVYDKQSREYRPLAWRDLVVLLRSVKGKAGIMLAALREAGIPAYAELDSGYFQETEVQVILSLLQIIDNPRQDIHLAAVLRSPLVGLRAAELAEIRLSRPGTDLWEALTIFVLSGGGNPPLQQKAGGFVSRLERWRDLARRKGVAELIWDIYRETGYYDYVGGMPGGTLRQANLRAMYDRARQYEATNFRGLFRFLRFIGRLQDKGSDLAAARALGESEDVVRVMSVHKSKGLEFPVVFVADLGKALNLQDSQALVLCHKTLGVGPYATDPDLRYRYPTLARHGIQHKLILEAKAEELRILYVALTRAREKLILVGSADKLAKRCAEWCRQVGLVRPTLPDALLAGAKTYLDWLCPAVARHNGGASLRQYGGWDEEPAGELAADPAKWDVQIHRCEDIVQQEERAGAPDPLLQKIQRFEPVEAGEAAAWVEKILGWQYPMAKAAGIPAKLSVTEIKRRFAVLETGDSRQWFERFPVTARPRFVQASGQVTAAEFGAAMHTVMRHVALGGNLDADNLREQVQAMVTREQLLAEQAHIVDIAAIAAFFAGPLGQRLCQSVWARRELPFSLMLPAERFFPELAGAEERIFVQGVIDCLFREDDGLVLVDYKTDQGKSAVEIAAQYAVQLQIYAEAAEIILKERIKEKYLYLFSTGEAVPVL